MLNSHGKPDIRCLATHLDTRTVHPPPPNMSRVRSEGRMFLFKTGHPVPAVTTIIILLATATIVSTAIAMGTAVALIVGIAPTTTPNTTIATGAIELCSPRTRRPRYPRRRCGTQTSSTFFRFRPCCHRPPTWAPYRFPTLYDMYYLLQRALQITFMPDQKLITAPGRTAERESRPEICACDVTTRTGGNSPDQPIDSV